MNYKPRISLRRLLVQWSRHPLYWFLLGLAIVLSAMDVVWTLKWIQTYGAMGEANPATRWLLERDLGFLWSLISVVLTCLGVVLMSSMCALLDGVDRTGPVIGLALLLTLRTAVVLSHMLFYTGLATTILVVVFAGPLVFCLFRAILAPGTPSRIAHLLRLGVESVRDARIAFITHPSRQVLHRLEQVRTVSKDKAWERVHVRKLATWLAVAILAPALGLLLIEFISYFGDMESLPDWMKRLGIVSEVQGRVFGVSLIVILIVTGILVYAILRVFDALGGVEPE